MSTDEIEVAKARRSWWQHASVYQIYPSTFLDSNGDGKGDLPGILSKLDYIKSLGVDAIWISPFFESPDFDMGYDISNYKIPDPSYGTMKDIEDIIAGCHERGMKILFDLVINHTSHLHPWFIESQKSKDNPFRKFYFWLPPRYSESGERLPPTNWKGEFGSSCWIWDESTEEYYLASFTPQQPDLNWEDEEVRHKIYDEAIVFWLEKGVDGFRVDTAAKYSKHEFKDVPITDPHNYVQPAGEILTCGPRLGEFLQEMAEKTFDKYGAVTIGELGGSRESHEILDFVHREQKKFSMMIRFDIPELFHISSCALYPKPWKLSELKETHRRMQELVDPELGGWLCNYQENHDQPRAVSAWLNAPPELASKGSKMLMLHLVTLSGTLLMYNGQEYGHVNIPSDVGVDAYLDIMTHNNWRDIQAAAKVDPAINLEDGWRGITTLARDHARTPIQWNASKNAGFTTGKPWMMINDRWPEINIEAQENDPSSVLNWTRKMLAMRKEYDEVFVYGHFALVDAEDEEFFKYTKTSIDGKEILLVVLNWTKEEKDLKVPEEFEGVEMLVSSSEKVKKDRLQPFEGRAYLKKL